MPKGGNPKTSRPHRIPVGSRVTIVENHVDEYHIKVKQITDYRGRGKHTETNIMLSNYYRYGT